MRIFLIVQAKVQAWSEKLYRNTAGNSHPRNKFLPSIPNNEKTSNTILQKGVDFMKLQERKITQLVLGALLASSSGLLLPSMATAKTADAVAPAAKELTVTSTSVNETGAAISATDTVFGNASYEGISQIVSATGLSVLDNNTLAADGFTVTINSGTMNLIYGGKTTTATAQNNSVIINGGTIGNAESPWGAVVIGGYGASTASGNTVKVTAGTINGQIIGGQVGTGGTASGNTVTISGGTFAGSIIGGQGKTASNNTITISGGTIGTAAGWTSINAGLAPYDEDSGTASGNTLTISGDVTLLGNVMLSIGTAQGASGTSSNNTLNLLTAVNALELSGGDGTTSGNTLNVAAKGITTGSIMGFDSINFYLPANIANGDKMITVAANTEIDGTVNLTGVKLGVTALSGVTLSKGNTVTLISAPAGITTDTTLSTADSSTLGSASFLALANLDTVNTYTLSISKSGTDAIIATVDNVSSSSTGGSGESSSSSSSTVNDVKKSTVEPRAATLSALTQGSDFLASSGFSQAANAVSLAAAEAQQGGAAAISTNSFTPFAATGGQKMRANSGSHVDTKGYCLNVGFAKETANKNGKLLFGPVVEYGRGTYDSYNNDVHGDGKSHYWGIGMMARQTNNDGIYYEGSLRGGRSSSDYSSNVTVLGVPTHIAYDNTNTYWSAHLGIGKVTKLAGNNALDTYLKYFYTRQAGDTVTIVGAPMAFSAVNSHRARAGMRITHKINEKESLYGGLAYQHEFDSEARATYNGNATPAPSVKGGSGMAELGWQVKASGPLTLDFGLIGWVGKQRGLTGQIGALWKF
ncbi:autotransporter domain-containing protein [Selenomonas ruminis]|uniref:Autotransporter domain-containing protein n=2 Tax=Selenomonas ruminis TaxID=2593411 RepID=A0A5D6VYI2_9FIRM|nr:autotransporter domain-containing protein [Selenomonas sp. mPRGC5]